MRRRSCVRPILGILAFMIPIVSAVELRADGFIIPRPPRPGETVPPLAVKYHRVQVEITNQVAKTTVDQVFINDFDRDIEGTYIFPLPEQASISELSLWVGDQKVEGEILDAQQARRTYEDIVRRMRDPGLLEYIGRNIFRARVFPIPARGEKRVQLSYTEVLKAERNFVRYRYPLDTERFSSRPIKEVSLSAKISSPSPISNIYSPSHKVSVRKEAEGRATVSFEENDTKPDKDFVLYYALSGETVGLSVINWTDPESAYFMLLASPPFSPQKESLGNKNLVLVLDSSGSMSGPKIRQAREAARYIVNHLNENDRFSIIDFDDGVSLFAPELQPARGEIRDRALGFIDAIQDSGGTNINEAILKALGLAQAGNRPNYILFLTDGQPTVGVTETSEILKNLSRANGVGARIFVFGVGNDVNTELLDRISSENRGASVYVGESENLEMALANYYEKISAPVLSDLKLSFKGIEVRDVYPGTLPDLFKGSQMVVVGKYKGRGPAAVSLEGKVGAQTRTFVLENVALGQDPSYNFLPRLWATRRIGFLLEEIRLHGPSAELSDEVKKLGLRFGIVTPFTSFLVTEKERVHIAAATPEAQAAFDQRQKTGGGAVMLAKATQALKGQDQASRVESELIRYKDDKTFYLRDGIWVDSAYQEGSPVAEVKFNSEAYFKLLAEKPGIGKYLSVGTKMIVSFEGVNYKIVDS
jgi:Ca-activated chloride channel family protein